MTLKETAQICVMIRKTTFAWKNETDDEFEEVVKLWHECLKDVPFEMAKKATMVYLQNNQYPPTVADIYRPYKEWQENQKVLRVEYNNIYLSAISNYPCYQDSPEERAEFDRITGCSLSKATTLSNMIVDYVRRMEEEKGCMPTLINWLKRIEKIE